MGVFIDIVIILVILGCIYGGYKRGLARCLLKILTSILAIIIALVLYKPFVNFIIDNTTIDDQIELSIENIIKQNSKEDDSNEKIINEDSVMPKPITNYINNNLWNIRSICNVTYNFCNYFCSNSINRQLHNF